MGAALVLPRADLEAMNLHLAEIGTQVSPGAHALLVLDGAGWHKQGGRLRGPPNITLLPLTPCAPELNLVGKLWAFLRSNRVFDTYDDIVDACSNTWNWLTQKPERITSIATRPWAQVTQ